MSKTTRFTWIDPLSGDTGESIEVGWHPLNAEECAAQMGIIDARIAGIALEDAAGFDPIHFVIEDGGASGAFIIQTRGFPPGCNFLIAGRVEHFEESRDE